MKAEKIIKYTYTDEDGIEKEICVLCGAKTKVPTNKHIDLRAFYIEGSGQLCYDCGINSNK